jgi:hypothetical protein
MDEIKSKEILEAYHQKVVALDQMQINGEQQNFSEPLPAADIPVIAYGLIAELKDVVNNWPLKREVTYEGKTYKTYSTALVNLEGEANLIFTEIQLMYNDPSDLMPVVVSVTDTKPDDNGMLHESHFSAKFYNETASEVQYVEYPYRQKESAKPTINTKAIAIVARRMIQQLPRSG